VGAAGQQASSSKGNTQFRAAAANACVLRRNGIGLIGLDSIRLDLIGYLVRVPEVERVFGEEILCGGGVGVGGWMLDDNALSDSGVGCRWCCMLDESAQPLWCWVSVLMMMMMWCCMLGENA
jgi:hypothetical protein